MRLQFKRCASRDVSEVLHQLYDLAHAAPSTCQQPSLNIMKGDLKMVLVRVFQSIHPHKLKIKNIPMQHNSKLSKTFMSCILCFWMMSFVRRLWRPSQATLSLRISNLNDGTTSTVKKTFWPSWTFSTIGAPPSCRVNLKIFSIHKMYTRPKRSKVSILLLFDSLQ